MFTAVIQYEIGGKIVIRGVATGVYRYIPPNQSTLNIFVCCSVSLQGLVNIYTHPNQISGYASDRYSSLFCSSLMNARVKELLKKSVHFFTNLP